MLLSKTKLPVGVRHPLVIVRHPHLVVWLDVGPMGVTFGW